MCLLTQQLQLPKLTYVRRDLGTLARPGQWTLIIQPSGAQTIAEMTCAVKTATQISVMNSAHFILSYRALKSLCSFIYSKQTHVYVCTYITPFVCCTNLMTHLHPDELLWTFSIQLPCASPLWGYYLHSNLIPALLSRWLASVTFTMFQEDDFSLYLFVKWVS